MTGLASHDLAQWLTDAARHLLATPGGQATLDEVCDQAMAVVADCRWAGVCEKRTAGDSAGDSEILAASEESMRCLHALQYQIGDGPCQSVSSEDGIVWCDDLAEDPRWPRFAAEAIRRGVRSLASIPLYRSSDAVVMLHLHSASPGAFDEVSRDIAQLFAAHAAVAVAGAREQAQLSQALVTRQQIGQLTGMLAERHQLTTDEAFALILRASQDTNTKVRDLAARVIATEDEARHQARHHRPEPG